MHVVVRLHEGVSGQRLVGICQIVHVIDLFLPLAIVCLLVHVIDLFVPFAIICPLVHVINLFETFAIIYLLVHSSSVVTIEPLNHYVLMSVKSCN